MDKILIPYSSVKCEESIDEQIQYLCAKIGEVFFNREIEIDYILPYYLFKQKHKLVYYLCNVRNIYSFDCENDNVDYHSYISKVYEIAKNNKYRYIFIPNGSIAKAISSCLSIRLNMGVTVDVIDMFLTNNEMTYIRSTSGRELLAYINCLCDTEIATFKISGCSLVKRINNNIINNNNIRTLIINKSENVCILDECNNKIKNTDIMIGIGKGVKREVVDKIKQYAQKYKMEIVTTKPCVEAGTFDYYKQVGQSGRAIHPQVYIAVGISGAMQHIVGVMGCRHLIAINPDRNAAIHQFADISIIAEAEKIFL